MDARFVQQRLHAEAIFRAGLQAVDPAAAIHRACRRDGEILTVDGIPYDLRRFKKILVLGAGKAGASMAGAFEELLGERITAGLVTVKYGHTAPLERIELREAGHPVPDERGLDAAREIHRLAASADRETLVIGLISGGGSALLPLPVDGVSLADKQETTRVLLACGATIHQINAIRKHLSQIKGGGLARAVYPGTLVTLILSDVVGDDLDSIASGPCVPDSRTFADCQAILEEYAIVERVPVSVSDYIRAGVAGKVPETPKADEEFFRATRNLVVASNLDALRAAQDKALDLGYQTLLLSSRMEGETRELAATHMAIAREIELHDLPLTKPACLLSGGETTVRIQGSGKGGRNQEFVLAAALHGLGMEGCVVLSAGTDGTDGPTDAAGALADSATLQRAAALGLDPHAFLADNDSYRFFERLDDLLKTGPTRTNVMDVRIILVI